MSFKLSRREMAGLFVASALPAAETKPNILVILSDDHSAPFLGCYGDPVVKTPNLDRFASEGMRFARAFTAAPQCVPSRTAIMTGRSPVAARMGRFNSPLPPDVAALPDLLRAQGYFTGICRRNYHLDGPPATKTPSVMNRVLDEHHLRTFRQRVDFLDQSGPAHTEAKVNEFFDKVPRSKPFFLWANFNDPHHGWDKDAIPQPYDPASLKLPRSLPDLPGVRQDLARYLGEVARMDGEFELVMQTLKARGHADNTIVVFMGDNGYAFPHGKGSLYDLGLNVPLIVRWPGKVQAKTVTSELISGEDITPTLLEIAGVSAPKAMSGRSFLKTLRGDKSEHRKYIFAARLHHGNATYTLETPSSNFDLSRCARSKTFKLIYNCTPHQRYSPVDSGRDPGWQEILAAHQAHTLNAEFEKAYFTLPRPVYELYDLEKDPAELVNLTGKPEHAGVEQELKEALYEKMVLDYDFLPLPAV